MDQLIKAKEILCDGESISVPSPNAKNHNQIEFHAKVVSFDQNAKVVISHGKTYPWCSAYIVIDAESVSVYEHLNETILLEKIPHELSIAGSINVSICVGAGFFAKLVIAVPSGSFSREIYWNGSKGDILAESVGAIFADCALIYHIGGVHKDVWLFGDSYFDHWCRHLPDRGLDDFYLDGYSGRSSEDALASLRMDMRYAKPKKLVWFMGMNDPDGEEVNPSWMDCYQKLRELCFDNDIELILATVPNTPSRNHLYKNEIIRNSGYRYLDISSAVGADIDKGWKSGLIASDEVHPSPAGAKLIADYIYSVLSRPDEPHA